MASEDDVKIVITAEDKASGVLGKIGDATSGLGSALVSFGEVAAAAVAVAATAITSFGISSLKAFAKAEDEMVIANQALKNSAGAAFDSVKAKMTEVSKAAIKLGYDDEAAAIAFAKLYQASNNVTQAQEDLKLAMDLAAFSGRDLESSAMAINKVHAGTTRVLKEFGIEVQEGTTSLEALALVHQRVGGTALAMSQTVSGQLRVLDVSWTNLKETVGAALAQAIMPFIQELTAWVQKDSTQKLIQDIADKMAILFTRVGQLVQQLNAFIDSVNKAGGLLAYLRQKFDELLNLIDSKLGIITILRVAWDDIATVFKQNLLPELEKLWQALLPMQPFLTLLAKVVGVILYGAFIALIKLIEVSVIVTIQALTIVITTATDWINNFKKGWDAFTDTLANVITWIDKVISAIKSLNVVGGIKSGITSMLGMGVPGFADGGVVPGPLGAPMLAMVHGGETVVPPGRGGSGMVINITGTFLSEDAADRLAAILIDKLKMNIRI
jgi:hypothetical protein